MVNFVHSFSFLVVVLIMLSQDKSDQEQSPKEEFPGQDNPLSYVNTKFKAPATFSAAAFHNLTLSE